MRWCIGLLGMMLMACTPADQISGGNDNATPEQAATMALIGSEWNIGEDSKFYLGFKSDGVVKGFGGCNRFSGTYTQKGEAVTIDVKTETRNKCFEDRQKIENRLLYQLKKTTSVDASHLVLILKDADGKDMATLRRSDWD